MREYISLILFPCASFDFANVNPRFVRITVQQDGHSFILALQDFSSYSNDELIVRLPKELKSGEARMAIENQGAESFSTPVSKTFEICCTP